VHPDVPIKQIAGRLGIDPTTVRRLIQRVGDGLGVTLKEQRTGSSNAKWAYCLSQDDAEKLIAFYESRRGQPVGAEPDDEASFQRFGVFYVIQLVPEALPNRVKVGYTDNLPKRLAEHQTAAPTARVLGSWPCKRSWDYAAMDSITRDGCVWVLNEVYEGQVEGFLSRAAAFFALMPHPDNERALSEHSPLRGEVLSPPQER
jgi:hypothetical protein